MNENTCTRVTGTARIRGRTPLEDCRDRIHFSLSDASGALRFESFEIVDAPECEQFEKDVRAVLLGRSLHDVQPEDFRGLSCPSDIYWTRALTELLEEHKTLFGEHD